MGKKKPSSNSPKRDGRSHHAKQTADSLDAFVETFLAQAARITAVAVQMRKLGYEKIEIGSQDSRGATTIKIRSYAKAVEVGLLQSLEETVDYPADDKQSPSKRKKK